MVVTEKEKAEHQKRAVEKLKFAEKRHKFMLELSKQGHSVPHWDTCNTCIEDFEEIGRFWAMYILRKYAYAMRSDIQEQFIKEFRLREKLVGD